MITKIETQDEDESKRSGLCMGMHWMVSMRWRDGRALE